MGRKVLSTEQIRRIEERTMAVQKLESWALMERAAAALSTWIQEGYNLDRFAFLSFVGPGNNGGDGVALARLLYELDAEVAVTTWSQKSVFSPDNQKNQAFAHDLGIAFLEEEQLNPWLQKQKKPVIAIDALFGIGFKGEMRSFYRPAVEWLNDQSVFRQVLSIDIPSGVPTEEELPTDANWVVQATHTLSFAFPKPSFFFKNHQDYIGNWHILDIGFDVQAIADENELARTIDRADISAFLRRRRRFEYKNSLGHVCLCGGSRGKYGAVVLASRACLRGGAGLLTVAAPQSAFSIIQSTVPEAMYLENKGADYLESAPDFSPFNALGLGPGMDQKEESVLVLKEALVSRKPVVIDADALNLMATHPVLKDLLHEQCILTPHEGEFRRLAGAWTCEKERLEKLREFTNKYNCHLVLKGPYTLISSLGSKSPGINTTGNPGMAVGGMGDVLTGLLTALLGRGYTAEQAAWLGVYVHGRAGDYAATEFGWEALLPSDLTAHIPNVWMELHEYDRNNGFD